MGPLEEQISTRLESLEAKQWQHAGEVVEAADRIFDRKPNEEVIGLVEGAEYSGSGREPSRLFTISKRHVTSPFVEVKEGVRMAISASQSMTEYIDIPRRFGNDITYELVVKVGAMRPETYASVDANTPSEIVHEGNNPHANDYDEGADQEVVEAVRTVVDGLISSPEGSSENSVEQAEEKARHWKRNALFLLDRMSAAKYGLTHGDRSVAGRLESAKLAKGVLSKAITDFEKDNPPDDPEAGWDPEQV